MSQDAQPPNRDVRSFLTYRIVRLHQAMNAQAVAILQSKCDLTQGQWRVIATIGSGMAAAARDIAIMTNMDPAMISRTLRSLEAQGLVTTHRPDQDRRVLNAELTDAGREIYEKVLPGMQARQERLLSALSPDERAVIFQIIEKLQRAAEKRDF